MYTEQRAHRKEGFDIATKKLVLFCIGLIILFIGVQFVKLASIGRIGDDISSVKYQQSQLELENEILRMEINELKRSSVLEEQIVSESNLVKKDVTVISASNNDSTIAQF